MQNIRSFPREKKFLPSELLQMYRQRAKLTQTELASKIGLQSKRVVQSWEVGDSFPKSDRLVLSDLSPQERKKHK